MKKIFSLLVLVSVLVGAQSPFPNGVRIINTTEVGLEDFARFPVMSDNGVIVDWVKQDSVIQFSYSQKARILDLIYIPNTSSISVSPTNGERGVSNALTVTYTVTPNDDESMTGSINQGIGSITIDGSPHNVSGGSSTATKTFTMTLDYTRQGETEQETKSATYTTYLPQWAGWSDEDDFGDDYSAISAETDFQKYIQSSASITRTFSPSGEYIWFISNKSNATVLDGNNFVQTVGTWGDGTSEFYRKSLTLTLADGTTTGTVYLYRSRNTKTLSGFTYKIQ